MFWDLLYYIRIKRLVLSLSLFYFQKIFDKLSCGDSTFYGTCTKFITKVYIDWMFENVSFIQIFYELVIVFFIMYTIKRIFIKFYIKILFQKELLNHKIFHARLDNIFHLSNNKKVLKFYSLSGFEDNLTECSKVTIDAKEILIKVCLLYSKKLFSTYFLKVFFLYKKQ